MALSDTPLFTYNDLSNPPDADAWLDDMLRNLQLLEFDGTDWTVGSRFYKLLAVQAQAQAIISDKIAQVAAAGNVLTATGVALTQRAKSFFQEDRVLGRKTIGDFGLTLAPGGGLPSTLPIGEFTVSDNQLRYNNAEPITFTGMERDTLSNYTLTASFVADQVGARYNVSLGGDAFTNDVTVDGLTVHTTPSTGTGWVTTTGNDEESDESLRQRCITKWGRLSTVEVSKTRLINVITQVTGVTNAYVDEERAFLAQKPGAVTVYIAQDLQEATDAQVSASYAIAAPTLWNPDYRLNVAKAQVQQFNTHVDVYYYPTFKESDVMTMVTGSIEALIARSPTGGVSYNSLENIFSVNEIVHDLEDLEAVRKVTLTPPTDLLMFLTASQQPQKLIVPTVGWISSSLINLIRLTQ